MKKDTNGTMCACGKPALEFDTLCPSCLNNYEQEQAKIIHALFAEAPLSKPGLIASKLRGYASELLEIIGEHGDTESDSLLRISVGLVNVATELTKLPKPAMAPGAGKRFGPTPTGLVKKPVPAPLLPPQGAFAN